MTILIAGLVLFFGSHMIAWSPAWHDALIAKFGRNPFRGMVSLLSAAGLVLIVIGYGRAPYEPVYVPPSWGRTLTLPLVFLAMVLLPAANMKTNLKRVTRHPMLWGVTAWGVGHLLVRGDAKALLLFGGFALYSLLAMWSANRRGAALSTRHYAWRYDLIVIAAGSMAFLVLGFAHRWLIGVPAF